MKKKVAVGLAVLLAGFLFSAGLFFLCLGLPPVQTMIQKQVSSFLPGAIEWEKIELVFLSPGVDIRGLKVLGQDGTKILHAGQISAELEFSKLFHRELSFSTIKFDTVTLGLEENENGQLNLVSALVTPADGNEHKSSSGVMPFNIQIKEMQLNNAQIQMVIPHEKVNINLGRLDISVRDLDLLQKNAGLDLKMTHAVVQLAGVHQTLDHLYLKTQVKDSQLVLSDCTLVSGKTTVKALGSIEDLFKDPALDIKITADLFAEQAAQIAGLQIPVTGFVRATANLNGTLENLFAQLDLVSDSLTAFEQPLDIRSAVEIKDGQLNISHIEARAKNSIAHGSGMLDLASRQLESTFSINAPDIHDFTQLAGIQSQGSLSVDANASGIIDKPLARLDFKGNDLVVEGIELAQLSGNATITDTSGLPGGSARINTRGLMVKGVQIGDISADALFAKGEFKINHLVVKNNRSAADFSGTIKVFDPETEKRLATPYLDIVLAGDQIFLDDFFKEYTGTLSVSGKAKGGLDALAGHVNLTASAIHAAQFQVGALDMRLDGKGTMGKPDLQGRLRAEEILVFQEKMAPLDLNLSMKESLITAKGTMGFKIDAACHMDQRLLDADIAMDSLSLSPYFKMAGQKDLSGSATGTISANGSLDKLQEIGVKMNFSQLAIFFRGKEAIRTDKLDLRMDNGAWVLEKSVIGLFEKGTATVSGRGQLPEMITLELDTALSLDTIDPMVEQIDQAKGEITLTAKVEGNIKDPKISASVRLDDLAMAVAFIEGRFRKINGSIRVDQNSIRLEQVEGFLDDGEFALNGEATIKDRQIETGAITLDARQLPLNFPDLMDIKINSALSLRVNRGKSSLTGEILLLEGLYYKDVKLNLTALTERKRPVPSRPEKKPSPFLENMDLNINVVRREPFLVENNLATLHISPDLNIHGTAANPLMSGRAQVDSGVIRFQKKEFEVTKGVIDFVNPYRIEPTIDMEGVVDVRNWTILLAVSGTPDNLDFNFTSTPSEEHADILSLLAFGKTTREMRTGQGGSNFSPSQILAGFVAENMQENLKDLSGLDYVDLGVSSDGTKMTLGKDLSKQLTVKYGLDVRGEKTVQKVISDYKLLEILSLSGYQDTEGDFGGGLKFRMEFR